VIDPKEVKKALSLIDEGLNVLRRGPADWYVSRLVECYELLLNKYAPFRVGDRVVLTEAPDITERTAPGWMHSRHFLVKGAMGVVREVDVCARGFSGAIAFDDESWIDRDGKANPVEPDRRHVFNLHERLLVRVPAPPASGEQ
jgi:hypothetical protein